MKREIKDGIDKSDAEHEFRLSLTGQIISLTQFSHLSNKVIIALTHWVIWGFNGVTGVKVLHSFYK